LDLDDLSDFADFSLDALEEDEELEEEDVEDFREGCSCFSASSISGISSVIMTSSFFCATLKTCFFVFIILLFQPFPLAHLVEAHFRRFLALKVKQLQSSLSPQQRNPHFYLLCQQFRTLFKVHRQVQ